MTARRTRALSVGVLTLAFVLTGCSHGTTGAPVASPGTPSSASSSAPSSSTPATTADGAGGDELKGRSGGYTVVPPEGWVEATAKANGVADIDLVLLSSKKVGGFANNLVVLATAGDQSRLDDELDRGKESMSAAGRTVSPAPPRSVAGAAAVGFTTSYEQQGVKVTTRSYGVLRGRTIFLLTLSSSQADADHAMAELDEMLSTWAWT